MTGAGYVRRAERARRATELRRRAREVERARLVRVAEQGSSALVVPWQVAADAAIDRCERCGAWRVTVCPVCTPVAGAVA